MRIAISVMVLVCYLFTYYLFFCLADNGPLVMTSEDLSNVIGNDSVVFLQNMRRTLNCFSSLAQLEWEVEGASTHDDLLRDEMRRVSAQVGVFNFSIQGVRERGECCTPVMVLLIVSMVTFWLP